MSDNGSSSRIDWGDVRRRIDAAGVAIGGTATRSPAETRALLEARATKLASPETDEASGETVELLVCTRDGESWAVETRFVVEVMRLRAATPLPGAEPDVFGVTAWRGEPLLLRELLPTTAAVVDGWVVSIGEKRAAFGLVVDALPRLEVLPVTAIQPVSDDMARERSWLRGITKDAVLIVDGSELIRSRTEGDPS